MVFVKSSSWNSFLLWFVDFRFWFGFICQFDFMNNIKHTEMANAIYCHRFIFHLSQNSRLTISHLFIVVLFFSRVVVFRRWFRFCVSFEFRFCELIFAVCQWCELVARSHSATNDSSCSSTFTLLKWKWFCCCFAAAVVVVGFWMFFSNVKTAWWNYTLIAISSTAMIEISYTIMNSIRWAVDPLSPLTISIARKKNRNEVQLHLIRENDFKAEIICHKTKKQTLLSFAQTTVSVVV